MRKKASGKLLVSQNPVERSVALIVDSKNEQSIAKHKVPDNKTEERNLVSTLEPVTNGKALGCMSQ